MGDFVFLNINATVCHDGTIENYVTISPGATLVGNVSVGERTFFGVNACDPGTDDRFRSNSRSGAVRISDIKDGVVVAGVPAKEVG